MARRATFLANRYPPVYPKTPFFFEDWHFNASCIATGHKFIVAKDTAIYYRQRSGSIMSEARGTVNPQIAPNAFFEPNTYCKITERSYKSYRLDDKSAKATTEASLHNLLLPIRDDMLQQSIIEPAINENKILNSHIWSFENLGMMPLGACYAEICRMIKGLSFSHVFVLPFHISGGGDYYIQKIIESLYQEFFSQKCLVILTQNTKALSM
jgi:hypothetical protein